MPVRPSFMSRLLWDLRRQQEADAKAAHAATQEAIAKSLLYPLPGLESRGAPVNPPNGKKAL